MSSYIPGLPDISYWDASPRFRELCKRKLGSGYIQGEPALEEMGRRAAFDRIGGAKADGLRQWLTSLEERDARRWVFALARAYADALVGT